MSKVANQSNKAFDPVADKLNEKPTMMLGLTQGEVMSLALKCFLCSFVPCFLIGIALGGFFISAFLMLSILLGVASLLGCAKLWVAPRKAGKPYGYKMQQKRANGTLVKLGVNKSKTLQVSRLWCHKR